jgi:large subunit ribosomal protein L21
MFAILETGSKQYKVEEGDVLEVELLDKDRISKADTVNFDSVLLVKDKDLHIGQPFVTDARIQAKVLEEFKGEKVIVFKKKSKKQYKRTQGHRQKLHLIQIEKIEIKPAKPAKPAKDVEDVSEEPKPAAKGTKKKAPAAKEKQVKTQTQDKKKAPAAKEKQVKTQTQDKKETPAAKEKKVKTQAQEKKQTKTKTSTPKKKPAEKEKEKE